jgi:hypothetical protein
MIGPAARPSPVSWPPRACPHPEGGLNYAANRGYIGTLDGVTATATPEGKAAELRYLDGPVPFEDADTSISESYGYLATPLYSHDGREELVISFVYNEYQEQSSSLPTASSRG